MRSTNNSSILASLTAAHPTNVNSLEITVILLYLTHVPLLKLDAVLTMTLASLKDITLALVPIHSKAAC